MKSLLFIIAAAFAAEANSMCSPIPAGADGRQVQTFRSLTGQPERRGDFEPTVYGEDIIYQGAQCPAGKICIETLHSNRDNLQTTNGYVIILDAASGNVTSLVPIRTRQTPPPPGQSLAEAGLPTLDPNRFERICQEFTRTGNTRNAPLWCGRRTPDTGELSTTDRINLDLFSYTPRTGYVPFSAQSRARTIEALNSGDITNSFTYLTPAPSRSVPGRGPRVPDDYRPGDYVDWSQIPSIQTGGAGSVRRLARLVGDVRRRLGCEPQPTTPALRLRQAVLEAREGLAACGLRFESRPGGYDTLIECANEPCTSGTGRNQARFSRPVQVNLEPTSSSGYECKSKFRGDVETITCKYRNVDVRYENTFRVQNGRLLGITQKDSEQRGEFTCEVAAPTAPVRRGRDRTRVQGQ